MLQLMWRARLVRAALWRRKKVTLRVQALNARTRSCLPAEHCSSNRSYQVRQYQKECCGQSVLAALWRGYRTKHYGPHSAALRARRAKAGLPEDPPPYGSNRMIKRDDYVLRRWAEKKQALAKRYEMPSHETLLQQYARRRAWAQQRSDDKQAVLHWSTRALLKTVKSYDEMRPEVIRSLQSPQPKRKSDKALGDFALQWLRGVGGFGWAQSRVVMMLQSLYRFQLLSPSRSHRQFAPSPQLTLHR